MIEYGKYTLNIRKIGIVDTEFDKKINNIFIIGTLIYRLCIQY